MIYCREEVQHDFPETIVSFSARSNPNEMLSSTSNTGGGSKNQMRRKLSKSFGKSMAATVPELVKILGGSKVIEKVHYPSTIA